MSGSNANWRTKQSNNSAYRKKYQRQKRVKQKQMAIEHLGSHCQKCGWSFEVIDVYDFHHLDPNEKEHKIAGMFGRYSWEKIKKELDKCIMLCANCHRIEHAKLRELEDST